MLGLNELQRRFALALTQGEETAIVPHLRGGPDPGARLAIHARHYASSLATALCDKFPASAWLVGADLMRDAALAYARQHPPLQPCIAEYGQDFPAFLSQHARAARLPYLQSFAKLERAIGQASIAVDERPFTWAELASLDADRIVDSTLTLQAGVHYVRAAWRIDELMQTYLAGAPPERFILIEAATPIEVRGARGVFRLTRLDEAIFAFRAALAANRTIGDAADEAFAIDPKFDVGNALREVVDAALVTGCSIREQESLS